MSTLLARNLTTKTKTLRKNGVPGLAVPPGSSVNVTEFMRSLTPAQNAKISAMHLSGQINFRWIGLPDFSIAPIPAEILPVSGLGSVDDYSPPTPEEQLTAARGQIDDELSRLRLENYSLKKALSGDMELFLQQSGSLSINAAILNNATAGSLKQQVFVQFRDSNEINHSWADFDLVITPGETVVDADVGVPVIDPTTVTLEMGHASFVVIFDTDAGATKTYASADSVDVTVQVSAGDTWLGHTVASQVVTWTVP